MLKSAATVALIALLAACATAPGTPAGASRATAGAASIAAAPASALVEQARAMLGQPYRWGGAEPGGFDCSGLVAYAARNTGLTVPRTAHEQQRVGSPVARDDLQTGDLVFLHLTGKELHVGIAVDKHRFVHAPSTGGYVRIDSLDAAPYDRGFFTARRIDSNPAPSGGYARTADALESSGGRPATPQVHTREVP